MCSFCHHFSTSHTSMGKTLEPKTETNNNSQDKVKKVRQRRGTTTTRETIDVQSKTIAGRVTYRNRGLHVKLIPHRSAKIATAIQQLVSHRLAIRQLEAGVQRQIESMKEGHILSENNEVFETGDGWTVSYVPCVCFEKSGGSTQSTLFPIDDLERLTNLFSANRDAWTERLQKAHTVSADE